MLKYQLDQYVTHLNWLPASDMSEISTNCSAICFSEPVKLFSEPTMTKIQYVMTDHRLDVLCIDNPNFSQVIETNGKASYGFDKVIQTIIIRSNAQCFGNHVGDAKVNIFDLYGCQTVIVQNAVDPTVIAKISQSQSVKMVVLTYQPSKEVQYLLENKYTTVHPGLLFDIFEQMGSVMLSIGEIDQRAIDVIGAVRPETAIIADELLEAELVEHFIELVQEDVAQFYQNQENQKEQKEKNILCDYFLEDQWNNIMIKIQNVPTDATKIRLLCPICIFDFAQFQNLRIIQATKIRVLVITQISLNGLSNYDNRSQNIIDICIFRCNGQNITSLLQNIGMRVAILECKVKIDVYFWLLKCPTIRAIIDMYEPTKSIIQFNSQHMGNTNLLSMKILHQHNYLHEKDGKLIINLKSTNNQLIDRYFAAFIGVIQPDIAIIDNRQLSNAETQDMIRQTQKLLAQYKQVVNNVYNGIICDYKIGSNFREVQWQNDITEQIPLNVIAIKTFSPITIFNDSSFSELQVVIAHRMRVFVVDFPKFKILSCQNVDVIVFRRDAINLIMTDRDFDNTNCRVVIFECPPKLELFATIQRCTTIKFIIIMYEISPYLLLLLGKGKHVIVIPRQQNYLTVQNSNLVLRLSNILRNPSNQSYDQSELMTQMMQMVHALSPEYLYIDGMPIYGSNLVQMMSAVEQKQNMWPDTYSFVMNEFNTKYGKVPDQISLCDFTDDSQKWTNNEHFLAKVKNSVQHLKLLGDFVLFSHQDFSCLNTILCDKIRVLCIDSPLFVKFRNVSGAGPAAVDCVIFRCSAFQLDTESNVFDDCGCKTVVFEHQVKEEIYKLVELSNTVCRVLFAFAAGSELLERFGHKIVKVVKNKIALDSHYDELYLISDEPNIDLLVALKPDVLQMSHSKYTCKQWEDTKTEVMAANNQIIKIKNVKHEKKVSIKRLQDKMKEMNLGIRKMGMLISRLPGYVRGAVEVGGMTQQ